MDKTICTACPCYPYVILLILNPYAIPGIKRQFSTQFFQSGYTVDDPSKTYSAVYSQLLLKVFLIHVPFLCMCVLLF